MPFLEYDDSRIRDASIIIRAAVKGFESNVVARETNGEVHYWLDSSWDYVDYSDKPFAKVIKKEDEKVYVVFKEGREVLVV